MIDPTLIAQDLLAEDVILPQDMQEVRNLQERSSIQDATFVLLDAIPRRLQDWYQKFLSILLKHGHKELVKLIDEKFANNSSKETHNSLDYLSLPPESLESNEESVISSSALPEYLETHPQHSINVGIESSPECYGNISQDESTLETDQKEKEIVALKLKVEQLDAKVDSLTELMVDMRSDIKSILRELNANK